MDFVAADEQEVRAGGFGDPALMVEHQAFVEAGGFGGVLVEGADHVDAGALGVAGDRIRGRAAPLAGLHGEAGHPRFGGEVRRPFPNRDRHVDFVELAGDTHLFRAAPGERTDVAIGELVGGDRLGFRRVDFVLGIGDGEIHGFRGLEQAFRMFLALEDRAVVKAFAFEHQRGIMEAVGKDVDLGIAPGNHAAVEPDEAVAVVERNK